MVASLWRSAHFPEGCGACGPDPRHRRSAARPRGHRSPRSWTTPERCSRELLEAVAEMSAQHDLQAFTHVAESLNRAARRCMRGSSSPSTGHAHADLESGLHVDLWRTTSARSRSAMAMSGEDHRSCRSRRALAACGRSPVSSSVLYQRLFSPQKTHVADVH